MIDGRRRSAATGATRPAEPIAAEGRSTPTSSSAYRSSPLRDPEVSPLRVELADQPTPRRMTSIRSDSPISSSRSAEINSTARPARRAADVAPDRRLSADVDAARRVGRDQQHRVAAHLAADDQLLLVAA